MDMHIGEKIAIGFFGLLGVFFLYLLLVLVPVSFVAEEKCLEKGYPKHSVTWNLKRYCMNIDGSVTVKVEAI